MTRPRCERRPHPAAILALVVGILCALAILASQVEAQPLPADQWTPDAHHTLARCVVGEATWSRGDHVAIAQTIANNWHVYRRNNPELQTRYVDRVRAACKALKSTRRPWIKALPFTPAGEWPEEAGRSQWRWARVLRDLSQWAHGRRVTPCKGAVHWGGPRLGSDSARARRMVDAGKWERVRCTMQTVNHFFRRVKR